MLLSLAVGGVAALIGWGRDRSFYSTVLIVIASYDILIAVMGLRRAPSGSKSLSSSDSSCSPFSASNEIGGSWLPPGWPTAF
ncbi:MAG TPA: hypothetical protein VNH65_11640 [Candidatus Acidoferrum sp.]|nr:hypothetical protein [Candidatus Acidoferrum sp.]